MTTSTDAGMAFQDWPLSNGSLNPTGWTEQPDQFAEHGHRLMGMFLGTLSIIFIFWTQQREARSYVRKLAIGIFAAVLSQGVLGGLRVLLDNSNTGLEHNTIALIFRVLHAMGAELVVCLLVVMAVVQSRSWIENNAGLREAASRKVQTWGIIACVGLLLQILIGAIMRHMQAGYAIPYFPHSHVDGHGAIGWLPTLWTFEIGINFAHRIGAILVTLAICIFFYQIWASSNTRKAFSGKSILMLVILGLQILLGASTIWSALHPHVASTHMLIGAFLLAVTWMLTFLSFRFSVHEPSHQLESFDRAEENMPMDKAHTKA